MPKGKGTYGSQVGRPPEDARTRTVKTYAGGGEVGYDSIGNPMYKKGGKVMDIPGEQVEWAQEKKESKPKADKPKKEGFFSKSRRDARKKRRRDRRKDAAKKSAAARKKNKGAGVKTGKMKVPGEQVKWAGKKTTSEKPVKTVKTKGGDYKVYKKGSKKAKSFREAFKAAKGKDFTWDGRKYSGKTKEQAAKAKAKPDKSLGMKPKKAAIKTPKPKKF